MGTTEHSTPPQATESSRVQPHVHITGPAFRAEVDLKVTSGSKCGFAAKVRRGPQPRDRREVTLGAGGDKPQGQGRHRGRENQTGTGEQPQPPYEEQPGAAVAGGSRPGRDTRPGRRFLPRDTGQGPAGPPRTRHPPPARPRNGQARPCAPGHGAATRRSPARNPQSRRRPHSPSPRRPSPQSQPRAVATAL